MIIDAYVRIRTIDQTIPDDVLDFMKNSALEKLAEINKTIQRKEYINKLVKEQQPIKLGCE